MTEETESTESTAPTEKDPSIVGWDDREISVLASIDGATTLSEAASLSHGFAAELRRLHDEGYLLRGPIREGKGRAFKPEGENPNLVGEHDHLHQHEHPHEPAEEPDRGFVGF